MKSILIVSLLLFSSLVLADEQRTVAFIEKAKSSSFGETLMGTLELELSNTAPGDYLVNLLTKMVGTVEKDIATAKATHDSFQGHCKQEQSSLKSEVRSHSKNVLESRKLISSSNQKLAWDKVELENSRRQLEDAKTNKDKLEKNRNDEAKEYEQKVNEINEALETLHQGKNLVQNNLRGNSFVEVTNKLQAHVKNMEMRIQTNEYKGRGYVALIAFISELLEAAPVQANQGSVQKVLDLIQGIIDELERAKNIEYKAEQERIANFNQLNDIYERSIVELGRKIDKLTNEINQLTQIITFNKNRISDNTRQIQIKKRQQLKLRKECQTEARGYEKEAKKRQDNLSLIQEALQIINENIEEFRRIVLENSKHNIDAKYNQ